MTSSGGRAAGTGALHPIPFLKSRIFELLAALLTAVGKFVVAGWLGYQLQFTVAAVAFWTGYVTLRHSWNPEVLKQWGFTRDGLRQALILCGGAFIAGLAMSLLYGSTWGNTILDWDLALLLLLYPIWGTVQQFLITVLFADNVRSLARGRASEFAVAIAAAVVFAVVHIPERDLMVAVFFLELSTVLIFFRTRNLLAIGLLHGWFASVFYFFGMGVDPLAPLLRATFG